MDEFYNQDQESSSDDEGNPAVDARIEGYRVFRVKPENAHRLFVIPLGRLTRSRDSTRYDPPPFYAAHQELLEAIINTAHDYQAELRNIRGLYRAFVDGAANLRRMLQWSNYKQHMTFNLAVWARDLIRQLVSLERDHCLITRRNGIDQYAFHIGGCDMYLSIGDYLHATNHTAREIHIGNVFRAGLTEVEARMPNQFIPNRRYEIIFEIRWVPFIIQEKCIDLVLNELGQQFLFPSNVTQKLPLVPIANVSDWEWHDRRLNEYQKTAVMNVLRAEHRPTPYIISGPPGTGKTSTLIEYINQTHKHQPRAKILICTPSNTAANVVLKMLIRSRWINVRQDVLRMVSYSHIISGDLPDALKPLCGSLPIENPPTWLRIIKKKPDLTRFRIVITTINYCGNFMRMGLSKHFTHLMVDEAGQALETETLIPFSLMRRSTHITLFGDEKQLGPVVLYRALKTLGFEISFFERLSRMPFYYDVPVLYSRLLNNYRSVPHLLKYYNQLFYQEQLIAMVSQDHSDFCLIKTNRIIFLSFSRSPIVNQKSFASWIDWSIYSHHHTVECVTGECISSVFAPPASERTSPGPGTIPGKCWP